MGGGYHGRKTPVDIALFSRTTIVILVFALAAGLGLLVAVPVLVASIYKSYADVFGAEAPLGLP